MEEGFDPLACPAHGCPDPALCASRGTHIHHVLYDLWKTSPDHWLLWGDGRGPGAKVTVPIPGRMALPVMVSRTTTRCRHLDAKLPDQPCGSELYPCKLHGVVTSRLQECAEAKRVCLTCDDLELPTPMLQPFARELRSVVEWTQAVTYPEGRYNGRGIVIPAGGWNGLAGVYVTASLLREMNCALPIEAWYIGDQGEYDPLFHHLTKHLGVTWKNVSSELKRLGIERRERLHGWAVKPLALYLSSFEQVLMLDWDCYPAKNPDPLWDHPGIKDQPAAFWNDNPGHPSGQAMSPAQWSLFGLVPPVKPIPGFESGQMLVDKRRSWHAIQVAVHLADRMEQFDATRGASGGVHGDKEIFSVAWRLTKTPYHMALPVKYQDVAFIQPDPDGKPAFIHRCNDKPRLVWQDFKYSTQVTSQGQFVSPTLPQEPRFHRILTELKQTIRPNLPSFRDGTQDEQIWREVHISNNYRLPVRMDGWKVIDIGAHAGFFALECLTRGAEWVTCVEPWRPNADALRLNLGPWQHRATLIEAAIAYPAYEWVHMAGSTFGDKFTGEPHETDDTTGPKVPNISLDSVIESLGPHTTVDFLKLDCEGGEFPAILNSWRIGQVKRIALEWHGRGPEELIAVLEQHGFQVETEGLTKLPGLLWAWQPGCAF